MLSKTGYPEGERLRAVWDCCHDLYIKLGRAPTRHEFYDEISMREPDREGISTHSRQWGEWMRYHGFKNDDPFLADDEIGGSLIPDEYMFPQYLRVIYAIEQLGNAASRHIDAWLKEHGAGLKKSEIDFQLNALTVNSKHRYRHRGSRKDMRSDKGHRYDAFFRSGEGKETRYVRYNPEIHGVWDLGADDKTPVLIAPPLLSGAMMAEMREQVYLETEGEEYFDTRVMALRQVALREGQPMFRRRVMEAYGYKCAVTGCSIHQLLEAAHLLPYAGAWHCHARHGILLKTDVHTLFDRGLLWLDEQYQVCLAPLLQESEYGYLQGKKSLFLKIILNGLLLSIFLNIVNSACKAVKEKGGCNGGLY